MMKLEKIGNALLKLGKTAVLAAAVFVVGCGGGSGGGGGPTPEPTPEPTPFACPTEGPLTDLRQTCDDQAYCYTNFPCALCFNTTVIEGENWMVLAGSCPGLDTLGWSGPTVSRTKADLEIACILEEDACGAILEPGSYAETSNQANNLVISAVIGGDRTTLDGYTFARVENTSSSNRSSGPGATANPAEAVMKQLATLELEDGDQEEAAMAIDAMERAFQAME